MSVYQLRLPVRALDRSDRFDKSYRERVIDLLSQDLDFHGLDSGYASHSFHSFPAKFPPQLPRKFIEALTAPGDAVLDPMMGSGTTVLEAYLTGRQGVGFDIDPLAQLITKVKVTPLDVERVARIGDGVLSRAASAVREHRQALEAMLEERWDSKTRRFIDYWFARETQIDLIALITEIEKIDDARVRSFLELAFSAIIITKSGGVSLAFDLAHTRPHRAKVVFGRTGEVVLGHHLADGSSPRIKFLTKTLRLPLEEFKRRLHQNLIGLKKAGMGAIPPVVASGNAQSLPLRDASMDLIVTSPPYAANAIDYMRAHKFSLAWMGYPIDELGQKRREYVGGEALTTMEFESLPDEAAKVVADIAGVDEKKGRVLHRYYSEMTRVLREMLRVLKPGKAAIVVVGNSTMRGKDTKTHTCLAAIGEAVGFEVLGIGVRRLDRNRRMMPAGTNPDMKSQIQQRMHEEYVIGFYKPVARDTLAWRRE